MVVATEVVVGKVRELANAMEKEQKRVKRRQEREVGFAIFRMERED